MHGVVLNHVSDTQSSKKSNVPSDRRSLTFESYSIDKSEPRSEEFLLLSHEQRSAYDHRMLSQEKIRLIQQSIGLYHGEEENSLERILKNPKAEKNTKKTHVKDMLEKNSQKKQKPALQSQQVSLIPQQSLGTQKLNHPLELKEIIQSVEGTEGHFSSRQQINSRNPKVRNFPKILEIVEAREKKSKGIKSLVTSHNTISNPANQEGTISHEDSISNSERKIRQHVVDPVHANNARKKVTSESVDDIKLVQKSRGNFSGKFVQSGSQLRSSKLDKPSLESLMLIHSQGTIQLQPSQEVDQLKNYCGKIKEKLMCSQMKIYKQSLALRQKDKTINQLFKKIEMLVNLNANLVSQITSEKSQVSSEKQFEIESTGTNAALQKSLNFAAVQNQDPKQNKILGSFDLLSLATETPQNAEEIRGNMSNFRAPNSSNQTFHQRLFTPEQQKELSGSLFRQKNALDKQFLTSNSQQLDCNILGTFQDSTGLEGSLPSAFDQRSNHQLISSDGNEINLKIADAGSSNFYVSDFEFQDIDRLVSQTVTEADFDTVYQEEFERTPDLHYFLERNQTGQRPMASTNQSQEFNKDAEEQSLKLRKLKFGASSFHGTFANAKNSKLMALSKVRATKVSVSQSSKEKQTESAYRNLELQVGHEELEKPSVTTKINPAQLNPKKKNKSIKQKRSRAISSYSKSVKINCLLLTGQELEKLSINEMKNLFKLEDLLKRSLDGNKRTSALKTLTENKVSLLSQKSQQTKNSSKKPSQSIPTNKSQSQSIQQTQQTNLTQHGLPTPNRSKIVPEDRTKKDKPVIENLKLFEYMATPTPKYSSGQFSKAARENVYTAKHGLGIEFASMDKAKNPLQRSNHLIQKEEIQETVQRKLITRKNQSQVNPQYTSKQEMMKQNSMKKQKGIEKNSSCENMFKNGILVTRSTKRDRMKSDLAPGIIAELRTH